MKQIDLKTLQLQFYNVRYNYEGNSIIFAEPLLIEFKLSGTWFEFYKVQGFIKQWACLAVQSICFDMVDVILRTYEFFVTHHTCPVHAT